MQDNFEMFLLVAEELSFTKAGEKSYVTQQTASYHISSLEKELNIRLFNRRPTLSLTEAGKLLYKNLKHIKTIETSIEQQLSVLREETSRTIRIGLNRVRARIILPGVLEKYLLEFPQVKPSFIINDTYHLFEMLSNNKLDFIIDIEASISKPYDRIKIYEETIYYIATQNFLINIAKFDKEKIEQSKKEGISLFDINGVPTFRNLAGTSFNEFIDDNLKKFDIYFPEIINVDDCDIQLEICGNGVISAFCPTLVLEQVLKYNEDNSKNEILIFEVKELKEKLRINLVSLANFPNTKYHKEFLEILLAHTRDIYKYLEIKQYK